MKTNDFGVDLIKQFEGLVDGDPNTPGLDPYICPTGFVTIGYGHVLKDASGQPLTGQAGLALAKQIHKTITPEEADALLAKDLAAFEADVLRLTYGVALNENQFAAIVSFVFNFGPTKFARSTLRKVIQQGDFAAASGEFGKWVKGDTNGDGKLEALPGLVRRREAERQLFIREVKPLSKSRTIWSSAGVIAATSASVAAEVATEIASANQIATSAGVELDIIKYVLAALAMIGAGFTIYARIDDRMKKGH